MRGTIALHPGTANAIGQGLQQVAAGETISHAEASCLIYGQTFRGILCIACGRIALRVIRKEL
jgi:hypothetical protein